MLKYFKPTLLPCALSFLTFGCDSSTPLVIPSDEITINIVGRGIDLDEAVRILEFTDKGSNSHSAWLTFMYPRLYIAKQLLREDGVIFISIDDSESSQMKLICDENFSLTLA